MSRTHRTYSIAIVSLVVALAAGAASATKVWQNGGYDAWLGSGTSPEDSPVAATASAEHSIARLSIPTTPVHMMDKNALAAAPVPIGGAAIDGANAGGSRQAVSGGSRSWSGWGATSYARRFASGSESTGSSASLGGMWHAMNPLSGHRGPSSAALERTPSSTAKAVATSGTRPAPAPKPSPSTSSRPAPPASAAAPPAASAAPSGITAPPDVPAASAAPPSPTEGFGRDETPIGGLDPGSSGSTAGGGTGGGTLGDGGKGRVGGAASGGGVSPTPEPATLAMFGTGLFGILGVIRRRRRL